MLKKRMIQTYRSRVWYYHTSSALKGFKEPVVSGVYMIRHTNSEQSDSHTR